jgi:hypothetical protein
LLLDISLEIGITEHIFWDMTIAEVNRSIEAYNKRKRKQEQEKASYDYILVQTLSKNISVILSGKGQAPTIQEVYPNLFNDVIEDQEQKIADKKAELSALRFKQFALSHNSRFNKEVSKANNE